MIVTDIYTKELMIWSVCKTLQVNGFYWSVTISLSVEDSMSEKRNVIDALICTFRATKETE